MMKYRDIEYTVVQGVERHLWKWSASVADVVITGQARSKLGQWSKPRKRLTGHSLQKRCDLYHPRGKRIRLNRLVFTLNGKPRLSA
jgi:hypothetical protein